MKNKKILIPLIGIVLFIILTILVEYNLTTTLDDTIYNILILNRSEILDNFYKIITKLGNELTVITITLILFVIMSNDNKYLLLNNVVSTGIINQVLKRIIKRPRPLHLKLIKQGGFSFPSGHAMISIGLYGILIYIIHNNIKNKKIKVILEVILSLIIILIGMSRIYVGVHYPSDIIAGYCIAIALIPINIMILKKIRGIKK